MEKGTTLPILDKGFVRYIDHLGMDMRVTETARMSYKAPSKGIEKDKKLLNYLFTNRHTSPFEQCAITFNIKMPIFVMRQFVRHRTFKLNEWSMRYSELTEENFEFYIPEKWRAQDTKNKQGSVENPAFDTMHEAFSNQLKEYVEEGFRLYRWFVEEGVARELARTVIPVCAYTEIYVTCDLHNLIHFLYLREDHHAQYEVREVAKAMRQVADALFPNIIELYKNYEIKVVKRLSPLV